MKPSTGVFAIVGSSISRGWLDVAFSTIAHPLYSLIILHSCPWTSSVIQVKESSWLKKVQLDLLLVFQRLFLLFTSSFLKWSSRGVRGEMSKWKSSWIFLSYTWSPTVDFVELADHQLEYCIWFPFFLKHSWSLIQLEMVNLIYLWNCWFWGD